MAAKPHLGLTQNSSPTTLANERRAAQIAVSKGRASGRPAHGAKLPPAAAGEIPAGRSQRNTRAAHGAKPLVVRSAIRRWRNPRPQAMAPAAAPVGWTAGAILHGTGCRCCLHWSAIGTLCRRRHTQVPPYEHGRTADMECRAGPACPAAGTSHRYPVYRWVPLRRAGACPRRCAALPITTGVGAGIPDGPGWGALWARQGCRALRWGVQKGRRPPPAMGWGRRPYGFAVGIAPSADGALDDWGFRAVRGAGVSPAAAGGSFAGCGQRPEALPLDSAIF